MGDRSTVNLVIHKDDIPEMAKLPLGETTLEFFEHLLVGDNHDIVQQFEEVSGGNHRDVRLMAAAGLRFINYDGGHYTWDPGVEFPDGAGGVIEIPTGQQQGVILTDISPAGIKQMHDKMRKHDDLLIEIYKSHGQQVPDGDLYASQFELDDIFGNDEIHTAAKLAYEDDGRVEVPELPFISASEQGMHVQAWVWLDSTELPEAQPIVEVPCLMSSEQANRRWKERHDSGVVTGRVTHEKPAAVEVVEVADHGAAPEDVTECGACYRQWDARRDPGPAALCHWCHGRGHSTHPVRVLSTDDLQGRN